MGPRRSARLPIPAHAAEGKQFDARHAATIAPMGRPTVSSSVAHQKKPFRNDVQVALDSDPRTIFRHRASGGSFILRIYPKGDGLGAAGGSGLTKLEFHLAQYGGFLRPDNFRRHG